MKRKLLTTAALVVLMTAENLPAFAQTQSPADQAGIIAAIVKQCVAAVRASSSEKGLEAFYRRFDAYYNPKTSKVMNNATTVGDQKPLFVFQKCMTEKGVPLG
ncbi:MAG: hypothetical protein WBB98_17695 [Xanthobacteraceae bacterium]